MGELHTSSVWLKMSRTTPAAPVISLGQTPKIASVTDAGIPVMMLSRADLVPRSQSASLFTAASASCLSVS